MAQQEPVAPLDEYGIMDTIQVTVEHQQGTQWQANIDLTNDESVAAVTLPLTWRPGFDAFRLDSASYLGTRTSYFALKTFFPDTVNSTVLIGLISDLGVGLPPLEPGKGTIARLFFTALDETLTTLEVDTTFIYPHNVLQLVVPDVRAILPVFETRNTLPPSVKQNDQK